MKSFNIIHKNISMQKKLIKALNKGIARRAKERGEPVFFQAVKEDDATIAFIATSPEGEDLCFLVDSSLGIRTFFEAVQCLFEFFDEDAHVHMWLNAKEKGIPHIPTALELAQDAVKIKDLLEILADDVANMSVVELEPLFKKDPYAEHYLCCEIYSQLSKLKRTNHYSKKSEI
jgi:hypothetical protein